MRLVIVISFFLVLIATPGVAKEPSCQIVTNHQSLEAFVQIKDPYGPPFKEISGLAISRKYQGENGESLGWVINDSGGGARIGLYNLKTGVRVRSYRLDATTLDTEELTMGRCGEQDCIYIGDLGNNTARETKSARGKETLRIFKIKEPKPHELSDNALIQLEHTTYIQYLDDFGKPVKLDAEAMFLDPLSGDKNIQDLYLISKWGGLDVFRTRLYKIDGSLLQSKDTLKIKPFNKLAFDKLANLNHPTGNHITRAAISPDGLTIAVGDYDEYRIYSRNKNEKVEEALQKGWCQAISLPKLRKQDQFETLAFDPHSKSLYEISEHRNGDVNQIGIHKTKLK